VPCYFALLLLRGKKPWYPGGPTAGVNALEKRNILLHLIGIKP